MYRLVTSRPTCGRRPNEANRFAHPVFEVMHGVSPRDVETNLRPPTERSQQGFAHPVFEVMHGVSPRDVETNFGAVDQTKPTENCTREKEHR